MYETKSDLGWLGISEIIIFITINCVIVQSAIIITGAVNPVIHLIFARCSAILFSLWGTWQIELSMDRAMLKNHNQKLT